MQRCLDLLNDYCRAWKLKVNHSKSKVVNFGVQHVSHFKFHIGELLIETTDHYKYFGIYFSKTGSFLYAKKYIVEKQTCYVSIIYKNNNLNLPLHLQLKLFDNTVLPILTYACEFWGYENNDMIEKLHTDVFRKK